MLDILGLGGRERGVLGADVGLGTGSRLEGHGAVGALVEDLAVGRLDVRLDGVQPPEHHLADGAPGVEQEVTGYYVTTFNTTKHMTRHKWVPNPALLPPLSHIVYL